MAERVKELVATHAKEAKSSSARMSRPPIRETITYPQIKNVTDRNNSCLNAAMACEHILICGHMINTVTPNEPCAPNCHHIFTKHGRTLKMKSSAPVSSRTVDKDFYCDACVESEFEPRIRMDMTSEAAEERRTVLREEEARRREKDTKYRKCYIAYKCTAVPCRPDGSISSRYVPSSESHPWDTSMPRTGANMFEDVGVSDEEVKEE